MDDRLIRETVLADFGDASNVIRMTQQRLTDGVIRAAQLVVECVNRGGKILMCGNGGSAADAQHFAGELVGRFYRERRALPALSLAADSSILTAIANDGSFEFVFSRQVEALGREDDVLVCLTTSGTSPNVIAAARKAREMRMKVLCLTGGEQSVLAPYADIIIGVPSTVTPRIQEAHGIIAHVICHVVEQVLFG